MGPVGSRGEKEKFMHSAQNESFVRGESWSSVGRPGGDRTYLEKNQKHVRDHILGSLPPAEGA